MGLAKHLVVLTLNYFILINGQMLICLVYPYRWTNANIFQFNIFNLLPRRRHIAETELPMTHQRRKLTN